MNRNEEIISVRIDRKSIALYTLYVLVFGVAWFFVTGNIMGQGALMWVFRLGPLLTLYQPVERLYWGLTVNTVEGKFTYRRLFSRTEEFFRQDIQEVKRTPGSVNGVAVEFLTIRTDKCSMALRCSDSGSGGLFSVSYTNVAELMRYLDV